MLARVHALLMSSIVGIGGCGSVHPVSPVPSRSEETVVDLFKQKIGRSAQHVSKFAETPQPSVIETRGGAFRHYRSKLRSIGEAKIDVTKTDSIVSPYRGEATFVVDEVRTKLCDTADEAARSSFDVFGGLRSLDDPNLYPLRVTAVFDFSEQRWVFNESKSSVIHPSGTRESFANYPALAKNLAVVFQD